MSLVFTHIPVAAPGVSKAPDRCFLRGTEEGDSIAEPTREEPTGENSHSAPGVPAAITLQVLAGQQGQPSPT